MDDEVELVSDGAGLAVLGNETAVERFLASLDLSPKAEPIRSGRALGTGAVALQAGSQIAANAGRWVKVTKLTAERMKHLPLAQSKVPGVSHAMFGKVGASQKWMQIHTPSVTSGLANPALLSGLAGAMAQIAMQQQMSEITDYLEVIDQKLDSLLRSQLNQVLARMDGVDLAIREAMVVRDAVGRVSEVTWSKVQNASQTIHETQGYALRQLADLAVKIEEKKRIHELVEVVEGAEAEVQKWLAVLARCFELHDAVGVLELDRVLDASPDEIDRHRLGLASARQDRLALIEQRTVSLLSRMSAAVARANSKVLFNPLQSPAVVKSSNEVVIQVHGLHEVLGIESGPDSAEVRRWRDAASSNLDKARSSGVEAIGDVRRIGRGTAKRLSGKLASRRDRQTEDTTDGE